MVDRISQALLLLGKLQEAGPAGYPIDALRHEFELSESELKNLTSVISQCGVPPFGPSDIIDVYVDNDRLFVDFANSFRGPMRLSVDELAALQLALRWCQSQELPWVDASRQVIERLQRQFSDSEAEQAEAVSNVVAAHPSTTTPTMLEPLAEAARLGQVVQFEYFTRYRDTQAQREVWPLSLFHSGEAWYLKAWDPHQQGYRRFHCGRMRALTVRETTFDYTQLPEEKPTDGPFDWQAGRTRVRIRLTPNAAVYAREVLQGDVVQQHPDGGIVLELHVHGWGYLRSMLLQFGAQAELLEPAELRQALAEDLQRYLAATHPA